MRIRIRDWEKHFERDRSKQWKHLQWVPLPNKQGAGYRKIMAHLNGAEIFGCWVALVEVASTCEPRGDLSKHDDESLTLLSMIRQDVLMRAIRFLSQELDWIEVIENLDSSVNNSSKCALETAAGSSILSNSVLSNSLKEEGSGGKPKKQAFIPPDIGEFKKYCEEHQHYGIAQKAFDYYSAANWHDGKGNPVRNWKQKLIAVWFKDENKDPPPQIIRPKVLTPQQQWERDNPDCYKNRPSVAPLIKGLADALSMPQLNEPMRKK